MPILNPSHKKFPLQLSLVLLSGLGIVWYIIYKASHTSFTHDESYTYTHYVHQGFMDIISYKTPYTNNHILNTVLMKYCELLFGSSELSLRLPNILAFILYSIFTILLLYKYIPKMMFPFYLLMVLNPHLLDFFALARGYGLSFAFLLMSLYYLSLYFTSKQNKHLILFNVGAFLAVMSNFSLLNYYVAALIVYNIASYVVLKLDNLENSYHFYKQNKINILSVILSGMVLYEPIRRISKMSLLDFGGKNGFMEDTVGTAIYSFFYEMYVTPFWETIFKVFIVSVVALTLIIILKAIVQRNITLFKAHISLVLINLILLAIVAITIAQHLILGNDYYIHRFALFFYPIFILNFIFLLNYFFQLSKTTSVSISYLCASLALFNVYINHNTTFYKDWKIDSDVKSMMQNLVLEHQKYPNKNIRLGINWLFEPGVNFYRYTWDLKWLNPAHRRGIGKYDDYFYILNTDKEYMDLSNKPVVYKNKQTGAVLLKNPN
jgi:acetyltransferase-like isoleucine patch superfamily enzyme